MEVLAYCKTSSTCGFKDVEGASLVKWMGRSKDVSEKFDLFQKNDEISK
jgi:hypothetical protein